MCLLTFMSEYTTASVDDLTAGAENNPDGFGFAIHAGRRIIHDSGLHFEPVLEKFLKLRATHNGPALFHSRITTHGGTSVENCHPFQVGRDELTIVAHNGMLPIDARNGKSDTRIFAEEMLPQMGGASILNSKKQRKKLSKWAAGSKLVFLSANHAVADDFHIINEKDGHWSNGVWWSNNSYKWARPKYTKTPTMYSSGWERVESPYKKPMDYVDVPFVEDCSYIDHETGEEVWGELWRCALCDHVEYVHEENIDLMDLCPSCDGCWFCHSERMLCSCYGTPVDLWSGPTHSQRHYDNTIDNYSF